MSEISLLLKLRRRSGVLAAAVAAVHKAGLTFQSQQAREVEGGPGLLLKAESDAVPEYTEMVSHLELVKGVDCVVEIQVDGEPLLPQSDEPESASAEDRSDDEHVEELSELIDDELERQTVPEPRHDLEPEPQPDRAPQTLAVVAEHAEVESESTLIKEQGHPRSPTEPETFDHHAEQDADPPLASAPDDPPAPAAEEQASKQPDSNEEAKSKREMTRAVRRRWRRYR
jgi:outer membrane biosynthesis protein TonB